MSSNRRETVIQDWLSVLGISIAMLGSISAVLINTWELPVESGGSYIAIGVGMGMALLALPKSSLS